MKIGRNTTMFKKIMLIGCTGEIGSRLTMLLINSGYEVFGVRATRECKIIHPLHKCQRLNLMGEVLELNFSSIRPEVLIHTAWYTAPNQFWESELNTKWVVASKRIISDFEGLGGKYLVVTGSCAEYSWNLNEPLKETSPEIPASLYGKSRLELLNWIRNRKLPFLWTRTFFQFGLNEPAGRLIPSIIDSLSEEKQYIIRSGKDVRDFVYVEDVAIILSYLITQQHRGVVNIGSGVGIEIEAASRQVARLLGREDLLKFDNKNGQKSNVVSNPEKLISLIGEYPWKQFDLALIESIRARS
ncbi:MAG: NAD(P)-dependent oxidoreductase [Chitinophagaceae bacterium]|nr:MAG: NAD(P)-dependent oxidoreductase [Chitinophagaceae bacterium]